MKIILISTLLLLISVSSVFAQGESVLQQRAQDVLAILNEPKDFEKVFTAEFLAAVPPEQIVQISKKLTGDFGKAVKVEKVMPQTANVAVISIAFEKGIIAVMNLTVENTAPFRVGGLLITSTEKASNSMDDVVAEMKALSGTTALVVAKLDDKGFQPLVSHNADKPLAIGSTFKLYILSELVRSIAAGERKWSDVVELKEKSLPSGGAAKLGNGCARHASHARFDDDFDQRQHGNRSTFNDSRTRKGRKNVKRHGKLESGIDDTVFNDV